MTSEFAERVATFSIHPEQATPRDVAKLAAEYMDLRQVLNDLIQCGSHDEALVAVEALRRHDR